MVKSSVVKLNGSIQLISEEGIGTTFAIELPVPKTVMVEKALLAKTKQIEVAIPLTSVESITPFKDLKTNQFKKTKSCQFNGTTIPIYTYKEIFNKSDISDLGVYGNHSVIILRHKENIVFSVD